MKKTKAIALCLSSPLLISSIPLFSTSCSDEKHIIVEDKIDFASPTEFQTWKDENMYKQFINNLKQWTTSNFNPTGIVDNPSVFNDKILDQYKKNLSADTIRAALAYSVAQAVAYDIDLIKGIQYPAILDYSIDVRYDESEKTFTGILLTNFSCSNDVKYSYSVYIPDAVEVAASYGKRSLDPEPNHNVLLFTTKNKKNTIQTQAHTTNLDGSTSTLTFFQSFVRLDFAVFLSNSSLKTFVGPQQSSEIGFDGISQPTTNDSSCEIKLNNIDVNQNAIDANYYKKSNITLGINYDSVPSAIQYLFNNISIESDTENNTFKIVNGNVGPAGRYIWPPEICLDAYIPTKTGDWIVNTAILYSTNNK